MLVTRTWLLKKLGVRKFSSESLSLAFTSHLVPLTSLQLFHLAGTSLIFVLTPMIRLNAFHYFSSSDLQASPP